jgi:DNA polymerase-3 subunit epsilon
MEFVAIDVETANADMSSICQIGLARYHNSQLVEEWKTYIDPEDYFDGINVSIHGIDEETVKGAPVIADVSGEIYRFLDDRVSVCHTHFDRVAVQQAFEKYKLRHPRCKWLDSARVVRRTWADFARSGYGLGSVCAFLGYDFTPHDALEDAKAAACILNAAIEKTGLDIEGWLRRARQPIDPLGKRDGNPEGPLYGEVLVFTGALEIPRREAADMAARIGCHVDSGVTKRTTILVVGDQDVKKLAGHEKSSKHRKAEDLISKGQAIRILRETDFRELAKLAG